MLNLLNLLIHPNVSYSYSLELSKNVIMFVSSELQSLLAKFSTWIDCLQTSFTTCVEYEWGVFWASYHTIIRDHSRWMCHLQLHSTYYPDCRSAFSSGWYTFYIIVLQSAKGDGLGTTSYLRTQLNVDPLISFLFLAIQNSFIDYHIFERFKNILLNRLAKLGYIC